MTHSEQTSGGEEPWEPQNGEPRDGLGGGTHLGNRCSGSADNPASNSLGNPRAVAVGNDADNAARGHAGDSPAGHYFRGAAGNHAAGNHGGNPAAGNHGAGSHAGESSGHHLGAASRFSDAQRGHPAGAAEVDEVALWPGVPDPARLLTAIADWLAGYGNRGTRRTYAEGLGLPVTPHDLRDWIRLARPPAGWPAALARYAAALGIHPSQVVPEGTTPMTPAGTGPGGCTGSGAVASADTGPITHAAATSGHMPPLGGPSTDTTTNSHHRRPPPPAARGPFRALHWLRWCAARGQNPLAARSHHVKAWLDALADAGAAAATRDRLLATVKACYAHLADEGLVDANPAALNRRRLGLVAPAGSSSTTITLTAAQVAHLCEAAAAPRRGASPVDTARARAVVTLLTLGLRVSELCDLDRADLHVTRGRRALRVRGKGGKTRIVYLHTLADQAVRDYLHLRDSQEPGGTAVARRGAAARPAMPLLVTRTGRRYQRQAIWQLLRRLATAAGEPLRDVADALHPHALRHFYVTAAVEAGAQLVHVQADVGHTSIDTTEGVYNSAARDPGRSAVDLIAAALAPRKEDESA